jgi:CBS domain-containing protein
MQADALAFISERAQVRFFPRESEILGPGSGEVRCFYIIEQGKVEARQAGEVTVTEYSVLNLSPGECFPIGAATAQRQSTNAYVAQEDTFCYVLAVEDFLKLMEISPEFHLFCTQYIASLLNQSRQQLQVQFSQRASEQQTLNSPLSAVGARAPIHVEPDVTIRSALELMHKHRIGSLVIVDAGRKPVGMFTQSDLLGRVVLSDVSQQAPISAVMSTSLTMLNDHDTAYDAMLAMATHGIRHVLVTDDNGRLSGVVSERDLFALQRIGLRQIRQSVESAQDVGALQQSASDVRQLACNMLAQGVGAEQLTQFISALNDALTRRVLELNLEQHDLEGVDWCWLAFGSEGRDEQTFSTDQDNGIIYVCPEGTERSELKQRLLTFARAVNEDLDRCGFTLCKGNIMASNPQWCLTVEEWEEQFADWIRRPMPEALLNGTIFFDFRPLFGNHQLAQRLRKHLMALTSDATMFLRAMAVNALDVEPPLGKIRDFLTDLEPDHPGKIDLKKYGSRLFVDVARIYALAAGIPNTNTVQRLRLAAGRLHIKQDEINAVVESLNFIQLLRLRHQHLDAEPGTQGDNLVAPDQLNELDRRILKESFRQARKIQQRLKLDYHAG